MASRKDQKEQARQARLEAEKAAAASKARTRRLQIIGGVVVAAVAIAAVLIAISSGGSKSSGLTKGKSQATLVAKVDASLAGIPQNGTTLGNPKAKYTLTYFGDLECPICAAFSTGGSEAGVTGGLPQFIQDQVKTGKAKIVYRSFCTATCSASNPNGGNTLFSSQQTAAYAAGKQDKFWQFAELFYYQQGEEDSGYVTPSFISGIAKQVTGLNLTTWQTDRGDPTLQQQVTTDESAAAKDGLQGTPSVIMTGPKTSALVGESLLPYSALVGAFSSVT